MATNASGDARPLHQQLTDSVNDYDVDYDDANNGGKLFNTNNNGRRRINMKTNNNNTKHEAYCILSAFLYFITITTFVYLFIMWIKQRMYVQVEQMQWW